MQSNRIARICSQNIYPVRFTNTTPNTKPVPAPIPQNISSDMIGPPDPVSNLRRIIFKKPKEETILERKYRILRTEVQEWNQNFWTQHNSRFFQERKEYLKNNVPDGKSSLTADEMSVFYKAFLDKNWQAHLSYNKEWYKKNFTLLLLAMQVKFRKILKIKDSKYYCFSLELISLNCMGHVCCKDFGIWSTRTLFWRALFPALAKDSLEDQLPDGQMT